MLTKPVYFVFLCPFRALALAFECFDEVACDADDCVAELLEFAATPGLASGRSTIAEESGSHILLLVPHCFAFRFFSLLVVAVCWGVAPTLLGWGLGLLVGVGVEVVVLFIAVPGVGSAPPVGDASVCL